MLSKKDQDRYDRMAVTEEDATDATLPGESAHGADAAAIGQQMLLEALGSQEAVTRAVVGRPRLDGNAAAGEETPTIRVRVPRDRKERLEQLRIAQHRKFASDLVRDAIDEYLERHEGDLHPIAS